MHRCDRLPAVLDVAAAGGAIFVLCSPRRLIRLGAVPDDHPAICGEIETLLSTKRGNLLKL